MFLKKIWWKFAYWGYPLLRDFLLFIRIIRHKGRQPYSLGFLKFKISRKEFKRYLLSKNYEHDVFAWIDDDEILSFRKIVNKKYQYHLRLYKDGEVKGHYEYAPDRRPLKHYLGIVFAPRRSYFLKLLKGFLK